MKNYSYGGIRVKPQNGGDIDALCDEIIDKIKDYKITRRTIDNAEQKTLCFRQFLKSELETHDEHNDEIENTLTELNDRIKQLECDYIKIKQQLLEIIKVINAS